VALRRAGDGETLNHQGGKERIELLILAIAIVLPSILPVRVILS
jgi:hypothetical protein